MAINQPDEEDFGPFQPISEESSSQAHQEELVMMGPRPEHSCKLKRPRDSDSEEPISTSRSCTDSADYDTTDSYPAAMQNTFRSFPADSGGGGSYTAVKESYSNSVEKTVRTSVKRRRVQHDGHEDDIGTLIQYASSGCYLWLNDSGTYDLEMTKYLPVQPDPLREKYLFKWRPRADRAGLLTVLSNNYYVALDTRSPTPKKLEIVRNTSSQFTDNELAAALVHRRIEESPEFCMLFFNYNDKCYQIKVDENGAPTVEELNSQDDLKKEYTWKASL